MTVREPVPDSENDLVDQLARSLTDEQLAEIEEADGFDPTEHDLLDCDYNTTGDMQFWRTHRGDAVLERAREIGRSFGEEQDERGR